MNTGVKDIKFEVSNDLIRKVLRKNIPIRLRYVCGWNGCPNSCMDGTQVLVIDVEDVTEDMKDFVFYSRLDEAFISDIRTEALHPSVKRFLDHQSEIEDLVIETRLSFNGFREFRFLGLCDKCSNRECLFVRHRMMMRMEVNWRKEEGMKILFELSRRYPDLLFVPHLDTIPSWVDILVDDPITRSAYPITRSAYGMGFFQVIKDGEMEEDEDA